jgi:hypothetical protein
MMCGYVYETSHAKAFSRRISAASPQKSLLFGGNTQASIRCAIMSWRRREIPAMPFVAANLAAAVKRYAAANGYPPTQPSNSICPRRLPVIFVTPRPVMLDT